MKNLNSLILIVVGFFATVGCGGGYGSSSPDSSAAQAQASGTLTVTPNPGTVAAGETYPIVPTGGTPPYTYMLANPGYGTLSTQSGLSANYIAPASTGAAQIMIHDAAAQVVVLVINVTNGGSSGTPLTVTPSATSTTVGGYVALSAAGGTPPYSYLVLSSVGGYFQGNIYFAPTVAGTYTTQVSDSVGHTVTASIVVTGLATPATPTLEIYRSWNGSDHLFSTSQSEGPLAGYSNEGPKFQLFVNNVGVPVYRCRSYYGHHFMSNVGNCEGQITESLMGFAYSYPYNSYAPLYRFKNCNGDFLMTLDYSEGVNSGYIYQGIIAYVAAP